VALADRWFDPGNMSRGADAAMEEAEAEEASGACFPSCSKIEL